MANENNILFYSKGGAVVEVFSAQGKDPVAKWKLYGGPSAIHKVSQSHRNRIMYSLFYIYGQNCYLTVANP